MVYGFGLFVSAFVYLVWRNNKMVNMRNMSMKKARKETEQKKNTTKRIKKKHTLTRASFIAHLEAKNLAF
jgi:hypothetical protein